MMSKLKIMILSGIFGALAFCGTLTQAKVEPSSGTAGWSHWARRLTGESEAVRQQSLQHLRRMRDLDLTLKKEIHQSITADGRLNTKAFLAFDVITGLEKRNLIPFLVTESKNDSTGYTYHTLNTLMTIENGGEMMRLYHERLLGRSSTDAVRLTLLDTLGRMNYELKLNEIRDLYQESTVDVKSGILTYLREMMILKNHLQYQELIPELMKEKSYELKMQALFLSKELFGKKKIKFTESWANCTKDENPNVHILCQQLVGLASL